jgi:sugar/nucleoside kinase (ribokinase family)
VDIVACVGEDFPRKPLDMFQARGIGIDGIEVVHGKTFRWKARYDLDLNTAHTLSTHLNVFKDFLPKIPPHLRAPRHLFLANIDPDLQDGVLRQVKRPQVVACDTMNFWIAHKPGQLKRLVRRVDILFLNESEARQFSGEHNLLKAAKAVVSMGPKIVVIKKGEHGALFYSKAFYFLAPAFLLESVRDPTGAGDSFAGGMLGYLSSTGKADGHALRKSVIYGTIMASFAVEDFSVDRFLRLRKKDILARYKKFSDATRF